MFHQYLYDALGRTAVPAVGYATLFPQACHHAGHLLCQQRGIFAHQTLVPTFTVSMCSV